VNVNEYDPSVFTPAGSDSNPPRLVTEWGIPSFQFHRTVSPTAMLTLAGLKELGASRTTTVFGPAGTVVGAAAVVAVAVGAAVEVGAAVAAEIAVTVGVSLAVLAVTVAIAVGLLATGVGDELSSSLSPPHAMERIAAHAATAMVLRMTWLPVR